jgi:hypothetical protein
MDKAFTFHYTIIAFPESTGQEGSKQDKEGAQKTTGASEGHLWRGFPIFIFGGGSPSLFLSPDYPLSLLAFPLPLSFLSYRIPPSFSLLEDRFPWLGYWGSFLPFPFGAGHAHFSLYDTSNMALHHSPAAHSPPGNNYPSRPNTTLTRAFTEEERRAWGRKNRDKQPKIN